MLEKNIEKQLIETIQTKINVDFILLFGSFSKGTNRVDSDIDLAFLAKSSYHLMNVFY